MRHRPRGLEVVTMAMTDVSQKPRSRRSSARNSLERQIIFFICLMVFLPVTVVQRLDL